jgi:hypothetical protein
MRPTILLSPDIVTFGAAQADIPEGMESAFAAEARTIAGSFSGFSADRGAAFFKSKHGGDWSCSTCHTENPSQFGKHAVTSKKIAPLTPVANPDRFVSRSKVEKWFRRNCKDVLNRECTAIETGDVLAFLLSFNN